MKKITIEVSEEVHTILTELSKARRRSLHQQVIFMLENQISGGMKAIEADNKRVAELLAKLDAKVSTMS